MGDDVDASPTDVASPPAEESVDSQRSASQGTPARWLAQLAEVDAETAMVIAKEGVRTEEQFQRVRDRLPDEARMCADRHRFRALTKDIALVDPFVIAPLLPDWARSAPLGTLGLSVRCMNVFKTARLRTVEDVLALGPIRLTQLRNLGRTSVRDFAERLYEFTAGAKPETPGPVSVPVAGSAIENVTSPHSAASSGTPQGEDTFATTSAALIPTVVSCTLRSALDVAFAGLRERQAAALRLWLGMDGPPRILEDIGGVLGVTRERARQLRNRAWELIQKRWRWPDEVVSRIEGLLRDRREPLFLDLIVAEDAWFDGFQDTLPALGRVIEDVAGDTLNVWPLNGRLIATRCHAEHWSDLVDAARAAVEREISAGVTRSEARTLIGAVAVAEGTPDLSNALWEELEPALHFAAGRDGGERLVSIGRRLRHPLVAILDESDRPLHMKEIVERLRERGYVNRNDYGTQNIVRAAMREAGGVLYGRSVYGLEKHLPVNDDVAEESLAELESMISQGAPGRQWHCSELADALTLRRPDFGEELDQFVVNAILARSTEVTYLGRLVWVGARRTDGVQDRLDVAAMCEAALLKAGRPLSKQQLRDAISVVRGLNYNFLPQASERVVRLAHGMWGLADRDVGVSAEKQKAALEALEYLLEARQKGLHVSELFDALRDIGFTPDAELDEWELLGIAQSDARFRVGRGQLVGLTRWADVRRRSIGQALAELQTRWRGTMTGEAFYMAVCALTERRMARAAVESHAARAGYVYDASTGLWDLAESPQATEVEFGDGG